ncbi:MAG: O-antigen ligase family protein [Ignavibacteria bacterium]|nr:O-antigen ligase family protein [Ignavibacteria bacterium]
MNGPAQDATPLAAQEQATVSPATLRAARKARALRTACAVAVTVQVAGLFFSIAVSSIAFGVLAACCLGLAITERGNPFTRSGIDWQLLAYLAAVAGMVVFAVYPLDALENSRRVLLIGVLYVLPVVLRDERALLRFILIAAAAAGLQSLIDIAVYYAEAFSRLGFFQHYMTSAGMKMLVLLMVLPLLFWKGATTRDRSILALCSAVTLYGLILTQTRSSWLGLLLAAVFVGIVSYRRILAGLAVLLVAFVLLAPGTYQERMRNMFATRTEQDSVHVAAATQAEQNEGRAVLESNQSRVRMWRTGWRMFLDHPFFGVGDGDMGKVYRAYVPDAGRDEGGHLHSTYVHILASHGGIGFLAMLVLFASIARLEWKRFRADRAGLSGHIALGALAAFIGFAANGVAEYNFGDHEILVLLWTSVGLTLAAAAVAMRKAAVADSRGEP